MVTYNALPNKQQLVRETGGLHGQPRPMRRVPANKKTIVLMNIIMIMIMISPIMINILIPLLIIL